MTRPLSAPSPPAWIFSPPRVEIFSLPHSPTGTASAAGGVQPYAEFPDNFTLARALTPYPRYSAVATGTGGGDHSGHSSYHSMIVKVTKRYSAGLLMDASYVLSK